ncbi:MAG TPA: hypothetical protein VGC49_08755 [Solirubrobacterales bacterium]
MKQIRKRLTYANVMSSIAVFLVLGGASALAASQLGKSSVGTKQLKQNAVTAVKIKKNAVTSAKIKKNAVTGAKVKNGSLSGADIDLNSLGTVPSAANANSANSANSLVGRIPVSLFTSAGTRDIATVGAFNIKAECVINNAGQDEGRFLLFTSVNGAAMDDNNGDEWTPFNVGDTAELYQEETSTGGEDIEVGEDPGLTAVAPDGTAILFQNESIGFNIAGHPGQCYFAGLIQKIG